MYISGRDKLHSPSEITLPDELGSNPFSIKISDLEREEKKKGDPFLNDLKNELKTTILEALKEVGKKILSQYTTSEILGIVAAILGSLGCCGCGGCCVPWIKKKFSNRLRLPTHLQNDVWGPGQETISRVSGNAAERRIVAMNQSENETFVTARETSLEESFITIPESPVRIRNNQRTDPPTYYSRIVSSPKSASRTGNFEVQVLRMLKHTSNV